MITREFNYPSADKETEVHAIRWIPDGEVRAVLQIAHGMVEHIKRYEAYAEYLTGQGFVVTGNDHIGHGRSVSDKSSLAHFPKDGNRILLKDIHTLRTLTTEKYPDVPYFILGHSMGSFLIRQYICMQGEGLAGAIIMGTGDNPAAALQFARALAIAKETTQGAEHHSATLTKMLFGSYNKRIENPRTEYDWLSRDSEQVDQYMADPLCGNQFTNHAFVEMFVSMIYLTRDKNLLKIRKDLPIFLVSGSMDPVGNYGKGVEAVYKKLQGIGIQDVQLRLYEDDRHEILNELDRETVYEELAAWLEEKLQ